MQSKSGKIGFILWIVGTQILTAQYKIEKLGPEINSDQYDEISPVVTRNGRTLYFTRIGTPEFNRTLIQDEVDLSKTLTEREYFEMLRSVYSQIAEKDVPNPVSSNINQDIWVADSRDQLFDRVYQPGFPLNNALLINIFFEGNAVNIFHYNILNHITKAYIIHLYNIRM